jgi:uncharacterized membrane protein SirB2
MTIFSLLKALHICLAFMSIGGFSLRGYWQLTGNRLLHHRLTKTLPHVVDTLLLSTAIGMLYIWGISPLQQPWLVAKIVGLLAYIALGLVALRFATTQAVRLAAFGLAVLVSFYIIFAAFTKSPWGPLALI